MHASTATTLKTIDLRRRLRPALAACVIGAGLPPAAAAPAAPAPRAATRGETQQLDGVLNEIESRLNGLEARDEASVKRVVDSCRASASVTRIIEDFKQGFWRSDTLGNTSEKIMSSLVLFEACRAAAREDLAPCSELDPVTWLQWRLISMKGMCARQAAAFKLHHEVLSRGRDASKWCETFLSHADAELSPYKPATITALCPLILGSWDRSNELDAKVASTPIAKDVVMNSEYRDMLTYLWEAPAHCASGPKAAESPRCEAVALGKAAAAKDARQCGSAQACTAIMKGQEKPCGAYAERASELYCARLNDPGHWVLIVRQELTPIRQALDKADILMLKMGGASAESKVRPMKARYERLLKQHERLRVKAYPPPPETTPSTKKSGG